MLGVRQTVHAALSTIPPGGQGVNSVSGSRDARCHDMAAALPLLRFTEGTILCASYGFLLCY